MNLCMVGGPSAFKNRFVIRTLLPKITHFAVLAYRSTLKLETLKCGGLVEEPKTESLMGMH